MSALLLEAVQDRLAKLIHSTSHATSHNLPTKSGGEIIYFWECRLHFLCRHFTAVLLRHFTAVLLHHFTAVLLLLVSLVVHPPAEGRGGTAEGSWVPLARREEVEEEWEGQGEGPAGGAGRCSGPRWEHWSGLSASRYEPVLWRGVASFPGSTPQLFSHRVEKRGYKKTTQCEKSWGVEPGNEATKKLHSARKAGEWSLGTRLQKNYTVREKLGSGAWERGYKKTTQCEKSWGVEPGNEAREVHDVENRPSYKCIILAPKP